MVEAKDLNVTISSGSSWGPWRRRTVAVSPSRSFSVGRSIKSLVTRGKDVRTDLDTADVTFLLTFEANVEERLHPCPEENDSYQHCLIG